MAVPFSNTKLRIPAGFPSLLEGIAREVLLKQPSDVYAFAAVYFENLLKLREEGVTDPASHEAQIQDRTYNNKSFQEPVVNTNDPEQKDAAVVIQTKYRQYQAKNVADDLRHEKAAVKIQSGVRGFRARKRVQKLRAEMSAEISARQLEEMASEQEGEGEEDDLDEELQDLMHDDEQQQQQQQQQEQAVELEKAATRIQAGVKGYQTRKHLSNMKKAPIVSPTQSSHISADKITPVPAAEEEEKRSSARGAGSESQALSDPDEEKITIDYTDPDVTQAIDKIQAGVVGMKVRREFKESFVHESEKIGSKSPEKAASPTKSTTPPLKSDSPTKSVSPTKSGTPVKTPSPTQSALSNKSASASPTKSNHSNEKSRPTSVLAEGEEKENESREGLDAATLVDEASTKIQAGYRGMQVRKEMKIHQAGSKTRELEEEIHDAIAEPELTAEEQEEREKAIEKIQAGFRGMMVREDMMEESKKLEKSELGAESDVKKEPTEEDREAAVTQIQAGVRGMKARRDVKAIKDSRVTSNKSDDAENNAEESARSPSNERLNDDREAAVTKIQAGVRGMHARNEVKKIRDIHDVPEAAIGNIGIGSTEVTRSPPRSPPTEVNHGADVEEAATRIQAGFKGMQARKELKSKQDGRTKSIDAADETANPDSVRETETVAANGHVSENTEQEEAASRIQAGFKGMKVRKELKTSNEKTLIETNSALTTERGGDTERTSEHGGDAMANGDQNETEQESARDDDDE